MKVKVLLMMLGLILAGKMPVAWATPALGVATDMYAYSETDSLSDEYTSYFCGEDIVPAISEDYHGFVIGPSGSNLTVFSLYAPWKTDIYLFANTGSDNFPLYYNGKKMELNKGTKSQIKGYNNPSKVYYRTLLPRNPLLWTTHVFEDSKLFYLFTAPVEYSGELTAGDYFFAVADTNRDGIVTGKECASPKTTSAGGVPVPDPSNPVPEPISMVLFGTGMAGLAVFKKYKKA